MQSFSPLSFNTHLSTEELALAFGLLGRGEMGSALLASLYEDLAEEQARLLFAAAGHALLAHGLGRISTEGDLQVSDDFQQTVFPLLHFDGLLQVGLVGETPGEFTIHLGNGQGFTAHATSDGIAHHLEHGTGTQLAGFLAGLAPQFGGEQDGEPLQVSLQALSQAQSQAADPAKAQAALTAGGLDQAGAALLGEDMAAHSLRGSLLRTRAGSETPAAQMEGAPQSALLFLQAPQRSWLFEFPSADENAQGTARRVTRAAFEQALAQFVS